MTFPNYAVGREHNRAAGQGAHKEADPVEKGNPAGTVRETLGILSNLSV